MSEATGGLNETPSNEHKSTHTTCTVTHTRVLILTGGWPLKCLCHIRHVHHDGLDTIALAFNLGHQGGHLVAVKGVTVLPIDVQQSHGADKWVTSRVTVTENKRMLLRALAGQEMAKS